MIYFKQWMPKTPGYYLAKYEYTGKIELIQIVDSPNGLTNVCGSTHYSRWLCLWSDRLEFDD